MTFRSTQRVYFDDLDALGILHNVRYLLFMERARGELFQSLGLRWQDDDASNPDKFHVVAAHEIEYLAPVEGEQELAVEITPTHMGRSSLLLDSRVLERNASRVYATAKTRLVRLDPTTRRPCPWSDRLRDAITPLLQPSA